MTRLELSRGKKSNVGKGALTGGLIGAGLGLVLGIGAATEDGGFFDPGPEVIPAAMASLGLYGAGIGALIGVISRGERWEEVSLDRLRVDVTPVASHGLGIGVNVRLRI